MPIPSFCLEYFVERIWLTFDRRICQTSLYNRAIPSLSIIRHGIAVRTKSLRSIFHQNINIITSLLLPSCLVIESAKQALIHVCIFDLGPLAEILILFNFPRKWITGINGYIILFLLPFYHRAYYFLFFLIKIVLIN